MNGSIMSSGSVMRTTYLTKAQYNWSNLPVLSIVHDRSHGHYGRHGKPGCLAYERDFRQQRRELLARGNGSSGSLAGIQSFSQCGTLPAQASSGPNSA